ncbi:cell division protein ZapD [Inhella gelatinilytica]|uniref:Cell division protein ZapD n=1 Tax=Inhella gelatinilytica TaxID=2795030 RepID=A0A931NCW3_9BURK|nr:cell division protein ZapD [Inhella gelatinilytica]MBH9552452.1 cell division protein ZapD [Inhella gelatinilytica]
MLLYEFPLNETIRTLLRLEDLFERLGALAERTAALDHHFALQTLFEVVDVCARSDLKAELVKELDRQKALLNSYRGNPAVSQGALDQIIGQIESASQGVLGLTGKPGSELAANEFLSTLRSRLNVPGGTCEFDLPGYHAWRQRAPEERQSQLFAWMQSVAPIAQAVRLVLELLRQNGHPQKVAAVAGHFQQTLSGQKAHQLLRLRIPPESAVIPEISGHRLMISIRLMRVEENRLVPFKDDASFEVSLCS